MGNRLYGGSRLWVSVPVGHGLLFEVLFQVGDGGDLLVGDGLLRCVSSGFCRSAFSFHFFFFLIFLVKGFVGLFVLELCLFLIYVKGFVDLWVCLFLNYVCVLQS